MKRIVISLLTFIVSLISYAYEVSPETAKDIANSFFGYSRWSDAIEPAFQIGCSATKSSDAAQSDLYVFNRRNGGFVVISGDNALSPVLGYSDSGSLGSYDNLPDNMKWWLTVIAQSVREARRMDVIPDMKTMLQWNNPDRIRTKAGTVLKALNTVQWAQGTPFNDLCPVLSNEKHGYAGCLPIAVCEIMCYHKWPTQAEGHVDSYNGIADGTVGGYDLGTVYDWDGLAGLDGYNYSQKSDALKTNAAQLVKDVGMTLRAVYETTGTGGQSAYLIQRFCEPFKYKKNARFETRSFYDEDVWQQMITDELDANRPILYCGNEIDTQGSYAAHAFVVDGYDSEGYVHINWGWANNTNGYFWLGEKYFADQNALLGLEPQKSGSSDYIDGGFYISNCKFATGCYSFSPTAVPAYRTNFKMEVGMICNDYRGESSASFKLVHLDKNDNKRSDLSVTVSRSNWSIGTYTPSILFTGANYSTMSLYFSPNFGDKIAVYVGDSVYNKYELLKCCAQGESVGYYPLTPYAFIDSKASYSVGEKFYFRLKNNDFPYTRGDSNSELYTEWRFYLDGELQQAFTDFASRFYKLPKAGTWTVQAMVKYVKNQSVKTVLTSQFEVK